MVITMPSGLSGEARGLKVKELQKLADPALARGLRHIDIMLGVITSVIDPGPYKFEPGEAPKWDSVLLGDRFAALIDVRCATWGPTYEFTGRCEECSEGYGWELDLRDLPRKPYPEETLTQLRDGANRFECEGPGGETVFFKLLFGSDEKAIEKYRRDNGGRWGLGDSLMRKIERVDGVDAAKLKGWIEELDAGPALEIAKRMDLVDGGIETEVEIVCEKCQWQQWVRLPFGKTFFVPGKKRIPAAERGDPTPPPKTPAPAAARGAALSHGASSSEDSERKTG